ncbi:GNAT family N-acetyltransferase [Nonlabens ponticola]|uniref:GNAT family N-acetyltransferase n=1 Tax=Nonlabens ponticola TaxID=2496866 RepID=A0A3S9MXZ6_9FLAO|nr:GNAT family N-acetyltransferase [Nonlabens ponticola]AZQ44009.1 GNAT family N-acetyltransferase [Nonlabens ponticola]
MRIRPIKPQDNEAVKVIIQSVIMEHGAPKEGTAYSDAATQSMYAAYQKPRAAYFVLESVGKIMGVAGVAELDNYDGNVCELQKMYFLPEARGKGHGKKMIELCMATARKFKYQRMYLETMDNMYDAQGLYKRVGFSMLDKPMGGTGHYSCPIHMILDL